MKTHPYFIGTWHCTWSLGCSFPGLTSFTNQLHRYILCRGDAVNLNLAASLLVAILLLISFDLLAETGIRTWGIWEQLQLKHTEVVT